MCIWSFKQISTDDQIQIFFILIGTKGTVRKLTNDIPARKYNNPCISLLKSNRCTILFGDLELANTTIAYDHEIFTDHMQSFNHFYYKIWFTQNLCNFF